MAKDEVKISEIAKAVGVTVQRIHDRMKKESWIPERHKKQGGANVFKINNLPKDVQEAIKSYMWDQDIKAAQLTVNLPVKTETAVVKPEAKPAPNALYLKDHQRNRATARLHFIRLIEMAVAYGWGVNKAIKRIAEQAKAGELPPGSKYMMELANARKGKHRTLAYDTMKKWWSKWQDSDKTNYAILAPVDTEKHEMPAWAPHFLKCYQVPQKISVPHALENLVKVLPEGVSMPTEDQAYRFIKNKYSKLDIHKGRMSPLSQRNIKGFTRRDVSGFFPLDIALCDGHSFKARIAHPVHGKPFHPEICWVVDAVTRKALGWSAGLAESAQTVADAVRHCVETNGIPSILYTDKGAGNMAKDNTEIITGLFTRLGITHETGIPGNSQARGRIERAMQSIWIRLAKEYATCTHKSMDKHAARTVYLLTQSDVKKTGRSDLLKTWKQFIDDCRRAVEDYNDRPHSELDKIRDQVTGKMRHMTPNECEAAFIAKGWERPVVEKAKLDALFRPQMMVTVIRAEVRLFGNIYFAKDLEHYHKERVIAEYDIHDASKVWVRDQEGRMICEALFEANKKSFFPVSKVEKATEEREKRRIGLKEEQIEDIKAEARGVIEAGEVPTLIVLPPEVLEYEERVAKKANNGQPQGIAPTVGAGLAPALGMATKKRKTFIDDFEIYLDIEEREKTGDASVYEAQWRKDYELTQDSNKKVGLIVSDPYCRFKEKGGEIGAYGAVQSK